MLFQKSITSIDLPIVVYHSMSILRNFHLSLATDEQQQQVSRQDMFRSRQNIVTNHHHRRYREPLCLFHRFTADGSSIGILACSI